MTDTPDGLGVRGKAIWLAYAAGSRPAGERALVHELARCADTLDRLDALAAGRAEAWASLAFDGMGEITLTVDKVLDERRTHQIAFKTLIGEVRQAGIKAAAASQDEAPEDALAKRRREREERERQLG